MNEMCQALDSLVLLRRALRGDMIRSVFCQEINMKSSTLYLSSAVAGLLLLIPTIAHAQVTTQGTPEVIHVEAKNVSIEEVLGALSNAYGFTWRSNSPLNKKINATYDGPLTQVLGRLLEGSNFVLTRSGNSFDVAVTSSAGKTPITSALSGTPLVGAVRTHRRPPRL